LERIGANAHPHVEVIGVVSDTRRILPEHMIKPHFFMAEDIVDGLSYQLEAIIYELLHRIRKCQPSHILVRPFVRV
jgi:hypothetical protein